MKGWSNQHSFQVTKIDLIYHHNDLSPDLKSLFAFQREVYQAIGYFPTINMIVKVCIITIAINKTITIIINKTITINMIVNVCVITAINKTITLPADNCDRYLVFITTTAHRHLVLDKKFNLAHLALAYI